MTDTQNNGNDLLAYNPKTRKTKTLKHFDFDDATNTGEAVRQIDAEGENVALLVLKMEGEKSVSLRVDVYTQNLELINSYDLSKDLSEITQEEDANNELRQGVFHFMVSGKFIYYENFSITRFLGEITGDEVKSVLDTDTVSDLSAASELFRNGHIKLFYQLYGNKITLLDTETGTLKTADFYVKEDKRYNIASITRAPDGSMLITRAYRDSDTRETLPTKIYLLHDSDLNFSE